MAPGEGTGGVTTRRALLAGGGVLVIGGGIAAAVALSGDDDDGDSTEAAQSSAAPPTSSAAPATGAAETAPESSSVATVAAASGEYPRVSVAKVSALQPGQPVQFDYPLQGQPNVLIDLGDAVPDGVGDNSSIVAFSSLCQHMGCPVQFRADANDLFCPCHQSKYDPARQGNVIIGAAQQPLPRITLEVEGDDIYASGVTGLIFGYRDNLAPGTPVA